LSASDFTAKERLYVVFEDGTGFAMHDDVDIRDKETRCQQAANSSVQTDEIENMTIRTLLRKCDSMISYQEVQ